MTRVKRDISVLEGIAADLKRFVAMHTRDAAGIQAGIQSGIQSGMPNGMSGGLASRRESLREA